MYKDLLFKCDIGEKQEITIGSGVKDHIYIKSFLPSQIKLKFKKGLLYPKAKKIYDFQESVLPSDVRASVLSKSNEIYVCWGNYDGVSSQTFKLPYRGIVKVGRSNDNNIIIEDLVISSHHLILRCEDGVIHVEDGYNGHSSTNGTYLNGKKITKAVFKSGDFLDLMHIRIILKNSELYFENATSLYFRPAESAEASSKSNDRKQLKFRRSPRTREQFPHNEIILAKPPTKGSRFEKRRGLFTSLLSSGAMIGASVAMGVASPALLAARAASLVSPVASMAIGHGSNKQGQKKYEEYLRMRQEKYGSYIEAQKALINQVADKQREIIQKENPAPADCVQVVQELKRTLWERSPQDPDYLDVRIGMGYEKICVNVKTPMDIGGFQMEEDETELLAKEIVEETRIVDRVPARVHLLKYSTIGIIGQRQKVVSLLRNMLVSISTAHFYEDVKIVGIFDPEEKELWEPLRWLPHVWDENHQSRFLAFNASDAAVVSDMFHDLLRSRLDMADEYQRNSMPYPHYIFILGSQRFTEHASMMQELLKNHPSLGATTIFSYDLHCVPAENQITYLPHQCQFIIDTDDVYGCCAYDKTETNNKFMFELDQEPASEAFDSFCRTMSAIQVEGNSKRRQLPSGITFLQGIGVSNVQELDAWKRWNQNHTLGKLTTPVAVTTDGKSFALDIGNENEPPVVLVAGMAGSGKSEFLATWLLSLSLCYHPYEISFVVIDFKGGALANSLQGLPHMVGKITDLKNDIQRTITSLMFEIKRREMIFEKEHIQKLSEYVKGYQTGKYSEPLPYLLIVCDEFAELKQQQPDIAKGLDSVARKGRSVGIRLICAMQNPMGVVNDELRANSCCQICLKVQNVAASKDMILRPDAARLTQNGRAYVRVGADVVFEQVQSYWSGAPYLGENHAASAGNQVRIVEMNGQRIKTVYEEKTRFRSDMTELQAVSKYLSLIAREHNVRKMPCPWLPELPRKLVLKDLQIEGGFDSLGWKQELPWLQIPIGIFDYPETQRQGVQFLNFESEGHYGIYGASRTGKTTLLKTILMGLGTWYTPEDINIYILDLGSWGLKAFETMPHVGGVALGNEEEKFGKLASMFKQLFAERKKKFSQYGINSLKAYRETVSNDMPAVILAIDNIVPIFELYPAYEALLLQIAREGSSYGIYMIFTANSQAGIRYQLLQNIRGAIAFEMNDKSDYSSIVGKVETPAVITGCKGRAFFKNSANPLVFQAALYSDGASELERITNLKITLQQMQNSWGGAVVNQIKSMPDVVHVEDVLAHYDCRNQIPIGLLDPDAEPAYLDLSASCCGVLSGTMGGGKSSMLCKIAEIVKQSKWKQKIYVVDSIRKSLNQLENVADGYVTDDNNNSMNQILTEIVQMLFDRQTTQKQEQSEKGTEFDAAAFEEGFTQICLLVDDIQDFVDRADDKNHKLLRIICKNGHGLGLICIGAGRVADMSKLSSLEPLTITMLASQQALVVSGSASAHFYLKNDLGYEAKSAELDSSHGLLYHNGACKKVKLIQ